MKKNIVNSFGFILSVFGFSQVVYAASSDLASYDDSTQYEDGLHGGFQFLVGNYQARGINLVDEKNEEVNSLADNARSINTPFILPSLDLSYNFNQGGNSFYLSTGTQTNASLSSQTRLGITQYLHSGVQLDFSVSPKFLGNEQEVWKDPYAVNKKSIDGKTVKNRSRALATGNSINFEVKHLLDGMLTTGYQFSDVSIKKENSGESLVNLSADDKNKLRRDYKSHFGFAEFTLPLSEVVYFIPNISLEKKNADGDSHDNLAPALDMSLYFYTYTYEYFFSTSFEQARYENKHAVFNKRRQDNTYSLSTGISFTDLLPAKDWNVDLLASVGKQESNIDMYDNNYSMVAVGVSHNF